MSAPLPRLVFLTILVGFGGVARAEPDVAPPKHGKGWIMSGMDGARVGVVMPLAKGRSFVPSLHAALEVSLQLDWWDVCLGGGAMIGLGGSDRALQGVMLELGAKRYLTATAIQPYVGFGLSPRFLIYEGRHFALAPHLALGALKSLERTWVSFELRVAQHVVPVDDDLYPTEVGAFAGYWW